MKLEVGIGLGEFGMMMVMTLCPALMTSDDCGVANVDVDDDKDDDDDDDNFLSSANDF